MACLAGPTHCCLARPAQEQTAGARPRSDEPNGPVWPTRGKYPANGGLLRNWISYVGEKRLQLRAPHAKY